MNKTYYADVCCWQNSESLEKFADILETNGAEALLEHAKLWDECQDGEVTYIDTRKTVCNQCVVAEDSDYVLTYSDGWPGEDYVLKRKLSQSQFDEEDERTNGEYSRMLKETEEMI